MSTEDRLKAAIQARTESVEPSADGWSRIEERVAAAGRPRRWRPPAFVVFPAAAAVLAAVVLAATLLTTGDDEGTGVRTVRPTEQPTTTTAPVPEVSRALWPPAGTSRSFDDPKALALSFATEFLGMRDPEVGQFGIDDDAQSGAVELRPKPRSPLVTAVAVARSGANAWVVTHAATDNLQLDSPGQLDTVHSPVTLTGKSSAFEATVQVGVLEDGQVLAEGPALAKTFFTGGGGGAELEAFETSVQFSAPSQSAGTLVLSTASAEDGGLQEATVIRVRLVASDGELPESFVATTAHGRLVQRRTGDNSELVTFPATRASAVSGSQDLAFVAVEFEHETERQISLFRIATRDQTNQVRGRHPALKGTTDLLAWVLDNSAVFVYGTGFEERSWHYSGDNGPAEINSVTWMDDQTLVLELQYEDGVDLAQLDIGSARTLEDAQPIRRVDNTMYRFPVRAGEQLAVYRSTILSTKPGFIALVDPVSTRVSDILRLNFRITTLDVDASGRHYLFVDESQQLWRWSGSGDPVKVADSIVDAEW